MLHGGRFFQTGSGKGAWFRWKPDAPVLLLGLRLYGFPRRRATVRLFAGPQAAFVLASTYRRVFRFPVDSRAMVVAADRPLRLEVEFSGVMRKRWNCSALVRAVAGREVG